MQLCPNICHVSFVFRKVNAWHLRNALKIIFYFSDDSKSDSLIDDPWNLTVKSPNAIEPMPVMPLQNNMIPLENEVVLRENKIPRNNSKKNHNHQNGDMPVKPSPKENHYYNNRSSSLDNNKYPVVSRPISHVFTQGYLQSVQQRHYTSILTFKANFRIR